MLVSWNGQRGGGEQFCRTAISVESRCLTSAIGRGCIVDVEDEEEERWRRELSGKGKREGDSRKVMVRVVVMVVVVKVWFGSACIGVWSWGFRE